MARLLSVAGLLLVAAAAHLGVRTGVPACGPGTYGPVCSAGNLGWLPLLVLGVVMASLAGATLWPLPAIWLVGALLATTSGPVGSPGFVVGAFVVGGLALAVAIVVDIAPRLRQRRSRRAR